MRYQTNESDILSTVRDFETMCEYIQVSKPLLTQKGDLSTKACFELNSRMTYPRSDAKKTDRLGRYPTICLYFQTALASGLLEPYGTKGGKTAIAMSETYKGFKKMNIFTRYLFVLLAWMYNTDIEELYARDPYIAAHLGSSIMDAVIAEIGKQIEFEWILREEKHDFFSHFKYPLQSLMSGHYDFLCHLRDFGLVSFDEQDADVRDAYHINVGKIRITRFGAAISAACDSRRFSWVNRVEQANLSLGDEEESNPIVIEMFEADFEKNPPGSAGFLAPFLCCFPEGVVDTAALNSVLFPHPVTISHNMVYEFKVQLERTCYRVIQCAGRHTFEDLHLSIQDAFQFNNDHLYSFFMDGKRWSRRQITSPYSEEPPYSNEVMICEAGLREKQTILYLFDYGDEWEFSVTVTAVFAADSPLEHPIMVKTKGKSPEQYPDWEGDFDDNVD